jgi:hypothetical protein
MDFRLQSVDLRFESVETSEFVYQIPQSLNSSIRSVILI